MDSPESRPVVSIPIPDVRVNRAREKRIDDECVVDAHTPEERAMGWYYYLEEKLSFPFTARCLAARSMSPRLLAKRVAHVIRRVMPRLH
jgi:Calcium binding